jgi:hypothetical protein
MLSLITDHGRATPLVWLTVDKRTLKDNRSLYSYCVIQFVHLAAGGFGRSRDTAGVCAPG